MIVDWTDSSVSLEKTPFTNERCLAACDARSSFDIGIVPHFVGEY